MANEILRPGEIQRLRESLTPENRCELAYSGETVARLLSEVERLQGELSVYRMVVKLARERALQDAELLTIPPDQFR